MSQPGAIENGVLHGHGGYLFLARGAHRVIELATGRTEVSVESIERFGENLKQRISWAESHNAKYLHIVFPDKQSVASEYWPFPTLISIAQQYVDRFNYLSQYVEFPRSLIIDHLNRAIGKVDTHYEAYGQIIIAARVAERVLGTSQHSQQDKLLAGLTKEVTHTGDLGSKLSPQISEVTLQQTFHWDQISLTNGVVQGNNGIIDIRFSKGAENKQRVLIIGDSFCRGLAFQLSYWFRETLFVRSGYFHPEIADAFRPDVLITGQVERYLDNCVSDASAPWYFSYPALNDPNYSSSKEFQQALSAVLRYPGKVYEDYIKSLKL